MEEEYLVTIEKAEDTAPDPAEEKKKKEPADPFFVFICICMVLIICGVLFILLHKPISSLIADIKISNVFREVEKLVDEGEYDEAFELACLGLTEIYNPSETSDEVMKRENQLTTYVYMVENYAKEDPVFAHMYLVDRPYFFSDKHFTERSKEKIREIKEWLPAAYEEYQKRLSDQVDREIKEMNERSSYYKNRYPEIGMSEIYINSTKLGSYRAKSDHPEAVQNSRTGKMEVVTTTSYYFNPPKDGADNVIYCRDGRVIKTERFVSARYNPEYYKNKSGSYNYNNDDDDDEDRYIDEYDFYEENRDMFDNFEDARDYYYGEYGG